MICIYVGTYVCVYVCMYVWYIDNQPLSISQIRSWQASRTCVSHWHRRYTGKVMLIIFILISFDIHHDTQNYSTNFFCV